MQKSRKIVVATALAMAAALVPGLAAAGYAGYGGYGHEADPTRIQQNGAGSYYGWSSSNQGGHTPWTPAWYQYCSGKYDSFNPKTGYYKGYDGQYHFCR